MKVLILASATTDTKPYQKALGAWGITSEVRPLLIKPRFAKVNKKKRHDPEFLREVADAVYATHGHTVDVVQLFISRRDWKLGTTKGVHYHRVYNGYQMCAVKERLGWTDTAKHEFMHTTDNICRIYSDVRLEEVVGVRDWDEEVVHRRNPKTKKYAQDFDDAFWKIRPYLFEAIERRRRLFLAGSLTRLGVSMRSALVARKGTELIET